MLPNPVVITVKLNWLVWISLNKPKIVLSPSMRIMAGLLLLLRSPSHCENWYPASGIPVNVTTVPAS